MLPEPTEDHKHSAGTRSRPVRPVQLRIVSGRYGDFGLIPVNTAGRDPCLAIIDTRGHQVGDVLGLTMPHL
jgi:hypothetical protein